MQQHVTVWVDSEGVAVRPELDVRDESKCEISVGQHKDVGVGVDAGAGSLCRSASSF